MPEVTITYSNRKTLKILTTLSYYLDFIISKPERKGKEGII